ncbi:TorD/DmsD family molecular chaperone [Bradyrhizobium genosp. A]|uniref:TorD/DmsD family molecular chaperone n=1 Tax=Bradyrhizobium genosp. A TaxID=83626 RepID=UPI003CED3DCD
MIIQSSGRIVDEIDQARAQEYALLATLLANSPRSQLLSRLADLRGDTSPIGLAHTALANSAQRTSEEGASREYFTLFGGLGDGALLPYASHYLSETFYGRPLARLRETLQQLAIERTPGRTEPEDHVAFLCEIMAGLAGGGISADEGTERSFFMRHMSPWIRRFFVDLERSKFVDFYASVGTLGRTFIEIEAHAFELPA